ncbi:MAG: DNA replication/repair protein RecF [Actinobacteria bacterium]|nr:MAG: DNA replication/repair protein RecF [Actinomycetota bacterium]
MIIRHLELTNFRNYASASIALTDGVTAIIGDNGQGKTNLVEALSYLATLKSFRGVPTDVMIKTGENTAIVRAIIIHSDGREVLIEAELSRTGRSKILVNKQKLAKTRDLLGVVRTTVFSPQDLDLVQDSPSVRREFIDDALVAVWTKNDALCSEVERVLKQRNALLKQSNGRLTPDIATTLDVWDEKLVLHGTQLGDMRARLLELLLPQTQDAYIELAELSQAQAPIHMLYAPQWRTDGLAPSLRHSRDNDIRRGSSTVGPHRDDIELSINNLPARTHASQGEQRTLALALRLAVHRLVTAEVGSPPVLILDDVLSELDPHRSAALLRHFPQGQVLITSAGVLPQTAHPDTLVHIAGGTIREA